MPSNQEYLCVFGIGFTVLAALMLLNVRGNDGRIIDTIGERTKSLAFSSSCSPGGSLDPARGSNCLERNGYRYIRVGLGSVIVKVGARDQHSLVFSRTTPGSVDFSDILHGPYRATWDD